jgi:hypothetical protein
LSANVAETLRGPVTLFSWHAPLPLQSPPQPMKW